MGKYLDERRDPEKSTEAAVQYLAYLHERFGNWELALAAYNAGPGTVSRAIKKHKTSDYWKLRKHLPRETRAYVPAFIAASYLMNYHYLHDIPIQNMESDVTYSSTHTVYETTSFQEVSILSGVSIDIMKYLNPAFVRSVIPQSDEGYVLRLPQNGMSRYLAAISIPDSYRSPMVLATSIEGSTENLEFFETITEKIYKVSSGDNLYDLARKFDCRVSDLMSWNTLTSTKLRIGQELMVMQTEKLYIQRYLLPTLNYVDGKFDFPTSEESLERQAKAILTSVQPNQLISPPAYKYHQIKRGQSLIAIAELYNSVSLDELLRLNGFTIYHTPKPGQKIIIREI